VPADLKRSMSAGTEDCRYPEPLFTSIPGILFGRPVGGADAAPAIYSASTFGRLHRLQTFVMQRATG
jgi:hypothetical protein